MVTNTTVITVRPHQRPLRAIRWDGKYHSAVDIARALNGRVIVWPVPAGYEHGLRRDYELDRSTGNVLDRASAFLVVYRHGVDPDPQRCDAGTWFVWDDDDVKIFEGDDEFDRLYYVDDEDAFT
ncbi:hypothetical protein KNT97_gp70 [Gordonia phage Rofo]|uniref:Uncharacterized protein n=3 Tax=Vividuovirus TaxID=2560251 RepID=A0A142K9X3_9CAUD|nr:hypothetical protein BJD57_gp74 [Gordonia phage Vivi2]YP_010096862.1 hypothetical protein KNT97_gp70 [Gordonia phage Rofo]YP_010099651.1 hypothetical protein KNU23_gp72 [Gordonia phage Tangent]AMS02906.1 hypothetical protein SEA_VIVI2_74 [Gordonia phage Vivi2]AXH46647.1 hypothetical protein SEA_ROFO_70 [Gordonia phage Rofo]AYR03621.1 hypothetical protein SEA_TANGENT_72 [Gordonia phage Tangent]